MSSAIPIYAVSSDGTARELGRWVHAEQRLELATTGFPLLRPGAHQLDSELPWIFWDMCPSGFLGRRLARQRRGLALNSDPKTWSAADALRVLTSDGEDLAGNLIIGDRSLSQWNDQRRTEEYVRAQTTDFFASYYAIIEAQVADADNGQNAQASSSLGGERPKAVAFSRDGGVLLKFSPPVHTEHGLRWSDLLRVEAHCGATLRHFGIVAAVSSVSVSPSGRAVLTVDRFDRLSNRGRRGTSTLYWYSMDRLGDVKHSAPQVVGTLQQDGHLQPADVTLVEQVHAFSAALGNNDAHLGNYGLLFDDQGTASLAPFYDILPMALAPRNDELPDRHLRSLTAHWAAPLDAWMNELVRRVEHDAEISKAFVDLWRRYIGL